jgi:hypothetical protein
MRVRQVRACCTAWHAHPLTTVFALSPPPPQHTHARAHARARQHSGGGGRRRRTPAAGLAHVVVHTAGGVTTPEGGNGGALKCHRHSSSSSSACWWWCLGCWRRCVAPHHTQQAAAGSMAAALPGVGPALTARAVAAGLLVGSVLCYSNTYFGLQTGWVTMGSLQSCILGARCAWGGAWVSCTAGCACFVCCLRTRTHVLLLAPTSCHTHPLALPALRCRLRPVPGAGRGWAAVAAPERGRKRDCADDSRCEGARHTRCD